MIDDPQGFYRPSHRRSRNRRRRRQHAQSARLGVQFVIDRDGNIVRTLPEGARGAHILPSKINGLSNANAIGVEVVAKDDKDVTDKQIAAVKKLYEDQARKYPGFAAMCSVMAKLIQAINRRLKVCLASLRSAQIEKCRLGWKDRKALNQRNGRILSGAPAPLNCMIKAIRYLRSPAPYRPRHYEP